MTLDDVEQAVARQQRQRHRRLSERRRATNCWSARSAAFKTSSDLENVVVKARERPVRSCCGQVARVVEAPQVKRGDAAVNGSPAVMLTIAKQPGADTRTLDRPGRRRRSRSLKPSLPPDIRINPDVYQQKEFIDLGIQNVIEALRDGGILVVIILFLFLLNFRTTFITLTAIPLSIVVTGLVFKWFGHVDQHDDARRPGRGDRRTGRRRHRRRGEHLPPAAREHAHAAHAQAARLRVVYEASSEVRNSIVFSTILVVLVFMPLFALEGMEGRLFTPLGVAYIVSILASLVVSLTVTPVLSYWLLPQAKFMHHDKDGLLAAVAEMARRASPFASACGIRGRFWGPSRRPWSSAC